MSKRIKDNRVDMFVERIGFEYDRASGLYLPALPTFEMPRWDFNRKMFVAADRTAEVRGGFGGLTDDGWFEAMYRGTFAPQWPADKEPDDLSRWKHLERSSYPALSSSPEGASTDTVADAVQRWLDDSEAE